MAPKIEKASRKLIYCAISTEEARKREKDIVSRSPDGSLWCLNSSELLPPTPPNPSSHPPPRWGTWAGRISKWRSRGSSPASRRPPWMSSSASNAAADDAAADSGLARGGSWIILGSHAGRWESRFGRPEQQGHWMSKPSGRYPEDKHTETWWSEGSPNLCCLTGCLAWDLHPERGSKSGRTCLRKCRSARDPNRIVPPVVASVQRRGRGLLQPRDIKTSEWKRRKTANLQSGRFLKFWLLKALFLIAWASSTCRCWPSGFESHWEDVKDQQDVCFYAVPPFPHVHLNGQPIE